MEGLAATRSSVQAAIAAVCDAAAGGKCNAERSTVLIDEVRAAVEKQIRSRRRRDNQQVV
ncbi:hypothetical protein ACIG56_07220 [Nocardia fusca]|uniref:hypothetical protein n=1 Tax=Nocardia fusca TaxID=941183 RepID=UPI0037CC13A0